MNAAAHFPVNEATAPPLAQFIALESPADLLEDLNADVEVIEATLIDNRS